MWIAVANARTELFKQMAAPLATSKRDLGAAAIPDASRQFEIWSQVDDADVPVCVPGHADLQLIAHDCVAAVPSKPTDTIDSTTYPFTSETIRNILVWAALMTASASSSTIANSPEKSFV